MPTPLHIAFWNVENLFDVETAVRLPKIQAIVGKDLVGWNAELLDAKLRQLSMVIRSMNKGKGPDILGVCEVENEPVLQQLVGRIESDGGRKYKVAHADTSDNRGIDVAFLYDGDVAKTSKDDMFQHWVVKRYATRELFQVNFTLGERKLVCVGNHWPSRTAGQYESEPYRMTAGETLAYWIKRIHEKQGDDVGIVVVGDFNDEPFNRSITEYALALNDVKRVSSTRNQNDYLLNLMWPLLGTGQGTHYYEGWNTLDQIMVSRGIATGKSGWKLAGEARIEARDIMAKGEKGEPHRFGIKPNQRDKSGFSDHFPVSVLLQKE
ncbi:endonuclease/exonuclease/phosphatase family protein [Crenobacter cavernae]|uniref:Endonuclease/exonuclease/phosphatase n=1 Tax=Crenobacter cavernae TaxID=2290923 RepID=A0A345Y218_9NEIS|nr:endonuclease/exonuclease/phosphatase family protein [Crenobacter cavernae]AXK37970.1 endonuclease/exonuclease/phosphatase [Crenobacter cavernae]